MVRLHTKLYLENSFKKERFIMKKNIFGTILLSSSAIQAMIVPIDNDAHISRRSESIVARLDDDASITRSEDQQLVLDDSTTTLSTRVNFRQVRDPQLMDGCVLVSIRDFIRSDTGIVSVGEWYTKQYALQKALLRYEHNLAGGFSNPVHELFATVNDIEHADRSGKIIVDDEYLDNATRIPHQSRATGQYEMDDANLKAKPFTEIFIVGEHEEEVVDSARVRDGVDTVAYIRTDTPARENTIGTPEERAGDSQFNYQRTETLEDWRRPDNTIFTKRTEEWKKVAKPTPPAPVPAPVSMIKAPVWVRVGGNWRNKAHYEIKYYADVRADSGTTAIFCGHDWKEISRNQPPSWLWW
jgi:hypothetical protein